jgi:ABC-type phosphate/phosphonate transport system substrate-binding protein
MKRIHAAAALISVAVSLAMAAAAVAAPKDIVIYVTRLGGDSVSAQPYVDKFLRYIETEAGWPAGSLSGTFTSSRKEALDYISSVNPGIGIMEPPLYFDLLSAGKVTAILQVESRDLVTKKLNVVVKDPAIKTLADLKGKRVWTTLSDYPRYLSRVVLCGEADADTAFILKQIGQGLKGVRGVLRGECEATLLDDEQLASAASVDGGKELRAIYTSPALPPIPVVLFGKQLSDADRATLVRVLKSMCGSAKGKEICAEMHMGNLVPLDSAVFKNATSLYDK